MRLFYEENRNGSIVIFGFAIRIVAFKKVRSLASSSKKRVNIFIIVIGLIHLSSKGRTFLINRLASSLNGS